MSVIDLLIGLIVGTLLGLALAPVVQAWIAWRAIKESRTVARTRGRLRDRIASRL